MAVVFFFVWRVALPEARFAAAFFVVVPFFFFFVRTTRRPRLAGADTSFADVSPVSMSMPKTDDSWSDSSPLPLRDLPPPGGG